MATPLHAAFLVRARCSRGGWITCSRSRSMASCARGGPLSETSISTVTYHSARKSLNNSQCGKTITANLNQMVNNPSRPGVVGVRLVSFSYRVCCRHVQSVGQVVECGRQRRRCRAVGELRRRAGFPRLPPRRNRPLYQGAAAIANVLHRCADRSVAAFVAGPRHSARMVAAVQIAGAECPDRASAEEQSFAAIGDRDAARCARKRSTPSRATTSRSSRPTSIRRASSQPPCYPRRLQPERRRKPSISTPRRSRCRTRSTSGVSTGARSKQLQAMADNQRFQVEAAYLTLASNVAGAAINEASLRGQIDATNRDHRDQHQDARHPARAIRDGICQPQRRGAAGSRARAGQGDLAAAAQGAAATTRSARRFDRRLSEPGPTEKFKLADLQLPTDLPVSLPSQMIEQRPDVRAAQENCMPRARRSASPPRICYRTSSISANAGYTNTVLAGLLSSGERFWMIAGNATQTLFDGGILLHDLRGARAPMKRRPGAIKAP